MLYIYLITCSKCLEQYVGSAFKFKTRIRVHKSNIKTKKERCGSARNFNSKCYHDINPFQYLKVQLTEQVHCNDLENIENIYIFIYCIHLYIYFKMFYKTVTSNNS